MQSAVAAQPSSNWIFGNEKLRTSAHKTEANQGRIHVNLHRKVSNLCPVPSTCLMKLYHKNPCNSAFNPMLQVAVFSGTKIIGQMKSGDDGFFIANSIIFLHQCSFPVQLTNTVTSLVTSLHSSHKTHLIGFITFERFSFKMFPILRSTTTISFNCTRRSIILRLRRSEYLMNDPNCYWYWCEI